MAFSEATRDINLLPHNNSLSWLCSSYSSLKNAHLCVNRGLALYVAILLAGAAQFINLVTDETYKI